MPCARQSRAQGIRRLLITLPQGAALGYGDYWAFSPLLFEFCHTILWRNSPLLLLQAAKPGAWHMDTILNFKIGLAVNSCSYKRQSRLQHSTLRNTQPFNIQNSKFKTQLLTPQFSLSAFCLPR